MQDGWIGRVIPFTLVQQTLLLLEYQRLQELENSIAAIGTEISEQLETFSEEEKESASFNEDKDAFVAAELVKEAKQLRADSKNGETFAADSYEVRILEADMLLKAEKEAKKKRNTFAIALHLKTKATIEKLNDQQVRDLLELKWIRPLMNALHQLPQAEIASLTAKVVALAQKYVTTYKEVVEHIHATEQGLSATIDELSGNEFDMRGLAEFQLLLKGE